MHRLKSFFASVESVDRGLDPFTTKLVVADPSRGRGAVCLAITPAMKKLGIKNRCRIFEIPNNIEYIIQQNILQITLDIWIRRSSRIKFGTINQLTDIWDIGNGIANHLARYGVYDLYGLQKCQNKLYIVSLVLMQNS